MEGHAETDMSASGASNVGANAVEFAIITARAVGRRQLTWSKMQRVADMNRPPQPFQVCVHQNGMSIRMALGHHDATADRDENPPRCTVRRHFIRYCSALYVFFRSSRCFVWMTRHSLRCGQSKP